MIKSLFKIFIIIIFIIICLFFYKKQNSYKVWGCYSPIIFETEEDSNKAIVLLKELGFNNILAKSNATVGINNYSSIEEIPLLDISGRLDPIDYRYDPFISSLDSMFSSSNNKDSIIYITLDKKDIKSLFKIHKSLNNNAIVYHFGDPTFLRLILNYCCFFFLLILLGSGCKTRVLPSIVIGIVAFFFLNAASFYSYVFFSVGYFLIILIIESLSFSNRYIKRNNIGVVRIFLSIIVFSIPTFIPKFLDYDKEIHSPVSFDDAVFDYQSLEEVYDESFSNISNYFTHFTFQKSFVYGQRYLFPSYMESVTISDYKQVDHYLSEVENVVLNYDDNFFNDFLAYCKTTDLGLFYLDYGKPFKLELNSLLSLYLIDKEYMQISILAVIMLISSFFFKKNGDKKLKY